MKNEKRKVESKSKHRFRLNKSSCMRPPTPVLPPHLSVVNVHGLRLYVNDAYWESCQELGIGGPGWEVAERQHDGLYLHATSSVHVVGSKYTPRLTDEEKRILLLEEKLDEMTRHIPRYEKRLKRQAEAEIEERCKQHEIERRKLNKRVLEAEAERDHAQAHVRKICSELLRRDEYQHAKKYLNQQLRKTPQLKTANCQLPTPNQ